MGKLKSLDYEILSHLIRDSRISDRKLAKTLGVSQPTVSRRRASLEKKLIQGYTAVPKWEKLGFEIVAFTFVKGRVEEYLRTERREQAAKKVRAWFMKQPNVIFASGGEGIGFDGIFVSFHRSYSEYAKFKRMHDAEFSDFIAKSESYLVSVASSETLKPFHLNYLAEVVQAFNKTKKEA